MIQYFFNSSRAKKMSRLGLFFITMISLNLSAGTAKPNIVMFLVDDMGWQDTSVPFWKEKTKFNKIYETPFMEKFASEGMKFTDAYAHAVCSPTRVSLMTGLNAARHKVTDWTLNFLPKDKKPKSRGKKSKLDIPVWNANGIAVDAQQPHSVYAKCLPEYLREAGYKTIHAGKAHFAAIGTPAADPKNIGFDVNIAGHAAGAQGSYLGKRNFAKNPEKPGSSVWDVPGLEEYHGKDIFLTEALTLEANKAISSAVQEKKPFFLYMAHYALHTPFAPDQRFVEKYRQKGLPEKEAMYAAIIEGMDKSLGDIMQKVEDLGQTENTIFLFMSDNGGLSAVGRGGSRHTHNKPLSSGKGSNREGGIRVPMLVKWPGVTHAKSTCSDYVIIEDFFSSILEMAGVKNPQQIGGVIDGKSFVPQLKGEGGLSKNRPLLFHYPNHWGPTGPGINFCTALRFNKWKLIFYHEADHQGGQFELFNLDSDIGETKNLASLYPEKVKELSKLMTKSLKNYDAQMPAVKATGEIVDMP
jgi:arylsulfatase A-like enzyme